MFQTDELLVVTILSRRTKYDKKILRKTLDIYDDWIAIKKLFKCETCVIGQGKKCMLGTYSLSALCVMI
jgi:hypothetical protein